LLRAGIGKQLGLEHGIGIISHGETSKGSATGLSATMTAAPITSAGRFSPLGPLGTTYLSQTRSLWSMATLPTPEEAARRILSIFALNNSRPDDVLMAEQANFAFRQAGGSAAEFQAGLEYAVQNGWLEIGENNTIKLTNAGFAEM
jgi:hypothetical protein